MNASTSIRFAQLLHYFGELVLKHGPLTQPRPADTLAQLAQPLLPGSEHVPVDLFPGEIFIPDGFTGMWCWGHWISDKLLKPQDWRFG